MCSGYVWNGGSLTLCLYFRLPDAYMQTSVIPSDDRLAGHVEGPCVSFPHILFILSRKPVFVIPLRSSLACSRKSRPERSCTPAVYVLQGECTKKFYIIM